jgi:hypothetical protein
MIANHMLNSVENFYQSMIGGITPPGQSNEVLE